MRIIKCLVLAGLFPILACCSSKNPKEFVGVWYAEVPGLFASTEILIKMDGDGRCRLGVNGNSDCTWTVEDEIIKIKRADEAMNLPIIAHSTNSLVVNYPDPKAVVHFRRIGE